MRFLVTRTSSHDDEQSPCAGAVRERYTMSSSRTVSSLEALPERGRAEWLSTGVNHRVEENCVVRDLETDGWFVDIDSIEDLLAFARAEGPEVIVRADDWRGHPRIEIYDDYRE